MPIRPYQGQMPRLGQRVYVDIGAHLIGDVELGDDVSLWPGVVVRGDVNYIRIGARTNVQDGSIIHVDPGVPVVVGARVTIGHGVMLHGCVIEDGCLIGNRAMVLDGARIGAGCLIGAGAVVTPNKQIPPGSVVMGSPGRVIRQVEPRDMEWITRGNEAYRVKSRDYARKLSQNSALPSSTTTA